MQKVSLKRKCIKLCSFTVDTGTSSLAYILYLRVHEIIGGKKFMSMLHMHG